MSTKALDKVIGWFVVREDGVPSVSRAEAEPEVTEAEILATMKAPIVPPGRAHDAATFAEVYRAAGIAPEEQERVSRALELFRTLPAGTPIEVQRAIVEASMKAFGIPVDHMIETAGAALGALDDYAAEGERRTEEILAEARARIARLEAEIGEIRKLVDLQRQTQDELVRATDAEKGRVRALYEFFGRAPKSGTTQ